MATSDEVYANGDDNNDESEYVQVFDSKDSGFTGIISGAETLQIYLTPVIARFIKLTVANRGTALDEIEVLTPNMREQVCNLFPNVFKQNACDGVTNPVPLSGFNFILFICRMGFAPLYPFYNIT